MRKIIPLLIFAVFFISFVSADIIINQQPGEFYNMGDFVKTSFKVVTATDMDLDTFFSVNIICNGIETQVLKQSVGDMQAGDERKFDSAIPLLMSLLGRTTGTCKIKSVLESTLGEEYDYQLTNEFEISDLINLNIITEERSFKPGENILFEGEAMKANGNPSKNGIVEMHIFADNNTIVESLNTIKNGYFTLEFSLPADSKAGQYLVNIDAYEVYKTERTNQGFTTFNIQIEQIPTSLEILFDNTAVEPGTNAKFKSILHDQTGEKIESEINITIKDGDGIYRGSLLVNSDDVVEFPIVYNEYPTKWNIIAKSRGLESKAYFNIVEKEDIKIELINETIILTNIGNVPYNESLKINVGNESLDLDVYLHIDETRKYTLTAPNGEYQIEVLGSDRKLFSDSTLLTGKVIDIKEASKGVFKGYLLLWIFLIFVLGFVVFIFIKRNPKKIFFGRFIPKLKNRKKQDKETMSDKKTHSKQNLSQSSKNPAELSLSIKGDKQVVSLVCLKLKNLDKLDLNKGPNETLQKIIEIAEKHKAATYENQDNLFFILAPLQTKTFKNEKTAVQIAGDIQEILNGYNKLAKEKIDFGISLHTGNIVAKQEKNALQFMSLGTLITISKKISSVSHGEIYMSKEIREKLLSFVKTEKQNIQGTEVYTIKRIRRDNKDDKKFINNFLKRISDESK